MSRKYPWQRKNEDRTCDRCHADLSDVEAEGPLEFKGGFRGYFCTKCYNLWNDAYHASAASTLLREHSLKIQVIGLIISNKENLTNELLEKLLKLVDEAAAKEDQMMKTLFALAKETLKPLPEEPLNTIPMQPSKSAALPGPAPSEGVTVEVKK